LGAPSSFKCSGACSTSVPEDLSLEEIQVSQDKDIPAINQGLISEETPEGSFLVEGDIIRPSPFRLLSVTNNKWPKGVGGIVEIPFLLSSKYDEPSRKVILEAFADFERFTCIRFVAYQGHRDFISILPMSGCFSSVGRSGGMQVVSLATTCLQKGRGIVLHELMHVLGFWHEHARADRDRYIRVNWNEILPGF
uniref:Metalloendopeptidase n=2 Tax=Nannospalax galili TaxID=1026970 RepID=A0A8C6RTE3_NANGA